MCYNKVCGSIEKLSDFGDKELCLHIAASLVAVDVSASVQKYIDVAAISGGVVTMRGELLHRLFIGAKAIGVALP